MGGERARARERGIGRVGGERTIIKYSACTEVSFEQISPNQNKLNLKVGDKRKYGSYNSNIFFCLYFGVYIR